MTAPDRRTLLARFIAEEKTPPVTAEDRGATLTWNLLYPKVVDSYLLAARPWPEETEELVHDVRVASRRLVEALELAGPMLRRRARREAQEHAKTLRRALGAGREADVMRADMLRLVEAAGLDPQIVARAGLVPEGDASLDDVKAAYPPELLITRALDILEMAANPKNPDLDIRQIGGPHLYRRTGQTEPLIDSVNDASRLEDQHRLRIRFKRMRYTTEMLAVPFSDVIDKKEKVKLLKALQDALGDLNDMKDLLAFLSLKKTIEAIGEDDARALRAHGEEVLVQRSDDAKSLVLEQAPLLMTDMRRAAGLIGPLV